MKWQEHIPTDALRPFVKAYRIIETDVEIINRVLPNTSLAMAFRYKGQVSYITGDGHKPLPASVISGLRKSVRLIRYLKNTAVVIVLFKEAGAKAFFEEPVYELFEESVSLDTFIRQSKLSVVEEQLAIAKNNLERIAIIEHFLLSRLLNHSTDKLISTAVGEIHSAKGAVKIKSLSNALYISTDAFGKRFRRAIGTSPKQFSSIVRMEAIAKQQLNADSFTNMAFDAGYYDQSHFNKDFKLFTGLTPTDFLKTSSFW